MKTPTIFSQLFKGTAAMGSTPTPHLTLRSEFEEALRHYAPSAQTIAILAKTPLVTLTAPSATGRNTIINALVQSGRYHFLVSDTTRPPRLNNGVREQNGREYFFRSESDILADIKNGAFVEAEVIHDQQVSGTSTREIEQAYKEGKIAIADVDIEGGINLSNLKPDTFTICLIPPSFDVWLARIKGREQIEAINLHRRLRQALKIFRLALADKRFIFVINDKLEDAISAVDELVVRGVHHVKHEQKARALTKILYNDTYHYLKKRAPEMLSGFSTLDA